MPPKLFGAIICRFKHSYRWVDFEKKVSIANARKGGKFKLNAVKSKFLAQHNLSYNAAKQQLDSIINAFPDAELRKKAREMGLDASLLSPKTFTQFKQHIFGDEAYSELVETVQTRNPNVARALHRNYFKFLHSSFPDRVGDQFLELVALCDLSDPAAWYPEARMMKRYVVI
jgi:cellobiose-specific phosphotransferase system component IIB